MINDMKRLKRIWCHLGESAFKAILLGILFGWERNHIIPCVVVGLVLFAIRLNNDPILK